MREFFTKFLKGALWIVRRTVGLFSPYVTSFERKVGKFFRRIRSTTAEATVQRGLLELMDENLIVVNLWMETKYKGYKYLTKRTRRRLYENVEKFVSVFKKESSGGAPSVEHIGKILQKKGLSFPTGDEEKLLYLFQIMDFLRPGRYYRYLKTASFSKLLADPTRETLEGDCNQIVTLYAYLYSLKFPLSDLRIKLLPEHVCLHFRGIDIEATNATFHNYKEDYQILPITEIISTNLLDLADFREEVRQINPRDMVKSSQLAYAISSLKELVTKNLNIAYRNLAISAMRSKNFKTAIYYFSKVGDRKSLQAAYHNAAVHYLKSNNFSRARYYASRSGNKDLERNIRRNEGVHYYKNNRVEKALKVFRSLGDRDMERACYQKQYNDLARRVSSVRTLDDARKHRSTYRKMLDIAVKIGDSRLQRGVRETLNKL